jgi:hypothetical protein
MYRNSTRTYIPPTYILSTLTAENLDTPFHLQEVTVNASKQMMNHAVDIPDYEYEKTTLAEQKRHLVSQLLAQMELASAVCMDSQFFSILRKRLLISHRILYAIQSTFHDKTGVVSLLLSCNSTM